ncbi:MAG: ABC transporter ATP-binding protein [Anaerolineaceae bacterium]|nr:ABC transporter ATP-binding protein [Anaerolineaceae bacterium]
MLLVDHLTYQYSTQVVLKDVSLQLSQHQIGLLVGQNGAGKSTLLRCLAGWTRVDNGTVTVNGISCRNQDRVFRQQVIFVPDTPDFYDELTGWEHLQYIAQLHHVPQWQANTENLLRQFHLWEQREAFPFTYSRGMRYKLALCMAFLVNPPLLLLDEPFGPLDALAARTLWEQLRRRADDHSGILLSSHTIPEHGRPDVLFHLHNGQVETLQQTDSVNLMSLLNDADDTPPDEMGD